MSGDARARILEAATELFGQQGFGSTSIRDVARAAGVTNPALYYHFGSKEALYLATVRMWMDTGFEALSDAVSAGATVQERLRAYVQYSIDFVRDNPAAARLLAFANHAPHGTDPQVDLMSQHLRSFELLRAVVVEGIESGELRADLDPDDALMLLAGQSMVAGFTTLGGFPIPDDLADRMLAVALDGIGG